MKIINVDSDIAQDSFALFCETIHEAVIETGDDESPPSAPTALYCAVKDNVAQSTVIYLENEDDMLPAAGHVHDHARFFFTATINRETTELPFQAVVVGMIEDRELVQIAMIGHKDIVPKWAEAYGKDADKRIECELVEFGKDFQQALYPVIH